MSEQTMLDRVKKVLLDSLSGKTDSTAVSLKDEVKQFIELQEQEDLDVRELKQAYRLLTVLIDNPEVIRDGAFINKVNALK